MSVVDRALLDLIPSTRKKEKEKEETKTCETNSSNCLWIIILTVICPIFILPKAQTGCFSVLWERAGSRKFTAVFKYLETVIYGQNTDNLNLGLNNVH